MVYELIIDAHGISHWKHYEHPLIWKIHPKHELIQRGSKDK